MDTILKGVPPWKSVKWIKTGQDHATYDVQFTEWVSNLNKAAFEVKDKIGNLDKEHKWELAKKMVNPYELVYTNDDDRLPPSLSLEQPLSRSYFKMVEILDVLHFFDDNKGTTRLRTAHVAEGPGGFVQAIYHRSEQKKVAVQSSFAITLRPTTTHVPGWKKATSFLHKNKQIKVIYGDDGTGDIYNRNNQDSFIKASFPPTGVHLFTADGGFDFSVDYTYQEQKVFHLLVCSLSIGLRVLRPGGAFVLKFFDCNSPHTQYLIMLLGRSFKEWTLYKPAMTRPCNSERYFLGRGFRGMTPQLLDILEKIQANSLSGLYPVSDKYSEAEVAYLEEHIRISTAHQIESIEHAIQLSNDPEQWWQTWLPKCLHISIGWCEFFRIHSVPVRAYQQLMLAKFPNIIFKS
jgi:23S rRNA U2552 (ribose-2'-O)-methylase RlmE/FtsJ